MYRLNSGVLLQKPAGIKEDLFERTGEETVGQSYGID